ncbi:hypothetical protein BH20BAC1_BH20BAC1_18900 [soil metagenome]
MTKKYRVHKYTFPGMCFIGLIFFMTSCNTGDKQANKTVTSDTLMEEQWRLPENALRGLVVCGRCGSKTGCT